MKTSNCTAKNSRTDSIKGGGRENVETRKKKERENGRVSLWWSSCGRSDCSCLNHESSMPLGHGLTMS